MENFDSNEIIKIFINKSVLIKGRYVEFCSASGIDYSWLSKFVNGKIQNPTIRSLEALDKAINLWNEQ